jgi:hypothetical protein
MSHRLCEFILVDGGHEVHVHFLGRTSYKIFVTSALLDPQAYKMAVAPCSQFCTPLAYTDYAHSVSTIRMAVNEGRLLLSNIQWELRLRTFVQSHKTQSTIIFLFSVIHTNYIFCFFHSLLL